MEVRIPDNLLQRMHYPVYRVSEAARYAGTSQTRVSYWFKGSRRGPALPRKTKGAPLSYLELSEVAFVAVMRRYGVSLQRIRRAREYLSEKLESEYPFAEHKFKTDGSHILLNLRDFEPKADERDLIVADMGGQTAWGDMIAKRFEEFDYEEEIAIRWHPAGRSKPIVIDPAVAFGEPSVKGVPTWVVKGRVTAGEPLEEIGEDFGLGLVDVRAALDFEKVDVSRVPLH